MAKNPMTIHKMEDEMKKIDWWAWILSGGILGLLAYFGWQLFT